MSIPAQYLKNQLNQEKNQSRYIPYAVQIDQNTIETKSGMLLQTLKIGGFHAETVIDEEIISQKELRNTLLKSLSDSSIGLQVTVKRRKIKEQLSGDHAEGFAHELHEKWQAKQAGQSYFINDWYVTVFKKPPQGKIRNIMDFANSFSASFNKEAREAYRQDQLKSLNKITHQILSTLSAYQPRRLTVVPVDNKMISEPLSFLYELINLEPREIAGVESDLSHYLSHKRIFFDDQSGTIALRDNTHKITFAAILSIKDYDPKTSPWLLDELLNLPGELTISQSFLFMDRLQARAKLTDKQRQLRQSDDKVGTTSESIDDAHDEISSGRASYGTHHYTVLCQADTQDALDALIGKVDAALNAAGIIAVREDRGVQAAFYAQLPANIAYIARPAPISTQNFASFANFHNTYNGQRFNNYWGEPIAILETVSGAPFYFNFHVADVGNTFMIGPMGSGKTLLELFLVAQSMRFGGRCIIFDKDRGAEIFARALGSYGVIAPGFSTGLNPTQMDDTPANRYHLSTLIKKVVSYKGDSLSDDDELRIKNAVDAIYTLPKPERRFRHIAPMLGIRKNGSLRARFDAWVDEGDHAWVFDNDVDHLSFDSAVVGFDMTHVLNDPIIQAALFLHLFYRIEQKLDGTRMRIVVAEGWRPLQDDTFRAQIQDWSSTPRKKEALLILDTQSVDDIANSPIGSKIVQESATQIYFANPKAEKEQYCGKFGLNEKEFHIIRSLNKATHFFLVKQGKNSVVARINLQGLDDQIAVLSGRTATVKLLDTIRSEVGDNPNDWLPIFYQRVRSSKNE